MVDGLSRPWLLRLDGGLVVVGVEVEVWVGVSLIQSGRRACAADFAHIRTAPSNAGSALGYEKKYEKKILNIYQI